MKPTNLIRPSATPRPEIFLKPRLAVDVHPRWPLEGSFNDLERHWHRPVLPHDRKSAGAALVSAVATLFARVATSVRDVAELPSLWAWRSQYRKDLSELSDYMLHDLGLTRAEVWRETSKPFWRD